MEKSRTYWSIFSLCCAKQNYVRQLHIACCYWCSTGEWWFLIVQRIDFQMECNAMQCVYCGCGSTGISNCSKSRNSRSSIGLVVGCNCTYHVQCITIIRVVLFVCTILAMPQQKHYMCSIDGHNWRPSSPSRNSQCNKYISWCIN